MKSTLSLFPFLSTAWPSLLIVVTLVLLPVGKIAPDLPFLIAAAAGFILAWRNRATLRHDAGVGLAVVLFLCYWLPVLISAPDAVAAGTTWSTVATTLLSLPFAVFAVLAFPRDNAWNGLMFAIAAVVSLWLLDAWVQMFTGYSIGGAMEAERLSGVFGAGNLKQGPVLAVLSPFVFFAAQSRWNWRGLTVAFVFQLVPILLAGSRAAWLMFALVSLAFVWRQTRAPLRFVAWSAVALIVAFGVAMIAERDSTAFAKRIERTMLVLQGSEHSVDEAGAGRLRIWSTAVRMATDHPINGVGARGFRYAYPSYAVAGDPFVDAKGEEGALHAHQIVLEVASETGLIGIVSWIAGFFFAIRAWRRAGPIARNRAVAPAIALVAMTFPLNTHLAFYSAWWGLLFWWLLALFCAALAVPEADAANA